MKPIYRYKFLRGGMKSDYGNLPAWKIGEWRKHKGAVSLCNAGFHCSKGAYQAFCYVHGEILARVEVRGASEVGETKEVYSEMRVVDAWNWTEADSAAFEKYSFTIAITAFGYAYDGDNYVRTKLDAWMKRRIKKLERV